MQRAVLYLVGVVFLLVSAAHVVRLILQVEILINGWLLPLWTSLPAAFVTLLLAWLSLREARR